ncbi:hypothetical protein HPP92_012416 [Vanilla planifolia]|uniref:Protein FLX-like 1 n=1 Tax=Vanilla planifolia TaxID=51239 RepID=A0A835R0W7_VANPL|nr:hypothetical protein HPP92_012416 [Vanilla planifolia]
MSGRNLQASRDMKAPPPSLHSPPPPFGRGMGPIAPSHYQHPPFIDGMRDGLPRLAGVRVLRPLPPPMIEERIAAQHHEIQGLLLDNQRLAATHVALKQEVSAAQHELTRFSHAAGALEAENDIELRKAYDKLMKMEAELREVEAMKAELIQVCGDVQKLNAVRQDLTAQVQMMTQDLARASAELQQAPAMKAEIEALKQEVQRARAAIEYEKKGYAENYEQGQVIEKNLILMAREVEMLRAEVANSEKRGRAAAPGGNRAAAYSGNYGNPDPSYGGNAYPSGYGINPGSGAAEVASQYGTASGPGHGPWGAYDVQHTLGRR